MSAIEAGKAVVRIGLDGRAQFDKDLLAVRAKLRTLSAAFSTIGAATAKIGAGITAAFGTALASLTFPVKIAADAQVVQAAFETLTGSVGKSKTLLEDLKKFAASTPFQFPELANASKLLLAFGTDSTQVVTELRRIGDVSSAIGAPIGEIAELYGKAKVQGRLFGEDINQLTGRGIPVITELAKQFGVAESEVKKLVTEGRVGFKELEQAFISLTSGSGRFAGGMEKASLTLLGLFSTLKDNIAAAIAPIGEALLPILSDLAKRASTVAQTIGKIITANQSLVPLLTGVAIAGFLAGTAIAALGVAAIAAGAAISSVIGFVAAIGGIATVINPVTLAIAGIVAAATALGTIYATVIGTILVKSGILSGVIGVIKDDVASLGAAFKQTFGGIAVALGKGDITGAAKIAATGITLAFLHAAKGSLDAVKFLIENSGRLLGELATNVGSSFVKLASELPKLMLQAISGGVTVVARRLAELFAGGFNGALTASIARTQADLDALIAAQAEPLQRQQRQGKRQAGAGPNTAASQLIIETATAGDEPKKELSAAAERVKSLRDEIAVLLRGNDAVELANLARDGATDAELRIVAALQRRKKAIDENRDALEAARQTEQARNDQIKQAGESLTEQFATPAQTLAKRSTEIEDLFAAGAIDGDTRIRALTSARDEFVNALATANQPQQQQPLTQLKGQDLFAQLERSRAEAARARAEQQAKIQQNSALAIKAAGPGDDQAAQQRDVRKLDSLQRIAKNTGKPKRVVSIL